MRILFLLTQDQNSPSGGGRYFPLAHELSKLNHQVTLAATHSAFSELHEKRFLWENVNVVYVAQMHVMKQENIKKYFGLGSLLWNCIVSTIMLTKAALSTPADLIIVGKPHPMNSIAGLIGRLRWHCPLYIDIDDDEVASGNFKSKSTKAIIRWFSHTMPKRANKVTTNTQYMASKLMNLGIKREKIIYIPNGIDETQYREPTDKQIGDLKQKLGLKNEPVVMYVGSISFINHPVDLLLSAFELLLQDIPKAKLIFVGGGEDFNLLEKLVKDRQMKDHVILCGKVSRNEINLYYHIANVTVDPVYDNEVARCRCPLKMFESWAFNVPFITSNVGDRELLVGEPPAALLSIPGNIISLSNALIKILCNPNNALALSQIAHERVHLYSWQSITQELEKHFPSS